MCRDGSEVHIAYKDQFCAVPSTAAARQGTGKAALARVGRAAREAEPAWPPDGRWVTEHSGHKV